jgi:mRNA-degrading endonuclease RelE of RelBE toxin-antitoxin system
MVFIEDHGFARNRRGILDDDELIDLMNWLAINPDAGQVIRGSGGLRKMRWAASGRGKRGGARVIYFWWVADEKILFLDIYTKNRKEDLLPTEIETLKRKVIK